MAEAGTLAVNADVLKLAGAGANSTYTAEAYTNVYIANMAEGIVCARSRYDWVTNYASVNTVGAALLRTATASLAAVFAIQADMSGYSSGTEAESMINVLLHIHDYAMKLLIDKKMETFLLS